MLTFPDKNVSVNCFPLKITSSKDKKCKQQTYSVVQFHVKKS